MNMQDYQQMTREQSEILMKLMFLKEEPPLEEFISEMEEDFGTQILHKRITSCDLPRLEPSAYIDLVNFADRPGTLVMALIDTLEKHEEIKPDKINAGFIAEHVYPFGFYKPEVAERIYDERRHKKPNKFDYLYF